MRPSFMCVALLVLFPVTAAAQARNELTTCAATEVELGAHTYRLLDKNNAEIGLVTQEWSKPADGVLRLRVVASGEKNSYEVVSTFEVDPITLWPLYASVRTRPGRASTELRLVENRLVGRGLSASGDTVTIDKELDGALVLPGTAAALVPLIDWNRCDAVEADVLIPPSEVAPMRFIRHASRLPFAGEMLSVYAIHVQEPGATTTVYVSRDAPRGELHRQTAWVRLVWVR